jgi:transketolase
MRGAVRLSALMNLPVTYVWSHDSIGLGEDGPTHQPVEHLAALRAIPNFAVVRPADANEVAIAWREIINRAKPVGLALSRQNLPVIDRSKFGSVEGVSKGAYVLLDTAKDFSVILIATGSEVALAIKAQEQLLTQGIHSRLISAPCLEWFAEQDEGYRESVIPKRIKARVSIEAGIAMPWHRLIGDTGIAVSLEHFGASASANVLFNEFGFNVDNVVKAAQESIAKSK